MCLNLFRVLFADHAVLWSLEAFVAAPHPCLGRGVGSKSAAREYIRPASNLGSRGLLELRVERAVVQTKFTWPINE